MDILILILVVIVIAIIAWWKSLHLNLILYIKNNKIQSIIIFLALLGLIILLGHIYYVQFKTDAKFLDELGNKDKPFYIVNVAIVLAALGTAFFTWWKNNINQRQTLTQEKVRQDSLYAKAVEFLDEKNDLIIRKGGVHILKDLALTSPQQTQKCLDMLCSINEIWMPKTLDLWPDFFKNNKNFLNIKNLEKLEINITPSNYLDKLFDNMKLSQLVLTVMFQIIKEIDKDKNFEDTFDLSYKYLCSIYLKDVSFNKFEINNINFNNALMVNVNFSKSIVFESDFGNSLLRECNFENSYLVDSDFSSARLENVSLNKADIERTKFLDTTFHKTDISIAKNSEQAILN